MDTARYRAFQFAAETGSIRNAAEALGYTSSGVSQLIQALEAELGTTLLFRGKKGVTLTNSGEKLLPIVKQIISGEDLLRQTAAGMNGLILGNLNIASYHSLSYAWTPDVVSAFQKQYPNVRINLYEGTQMDIIDRLVTGKADVAFFNDSAMTEKHDWIPLCYDPMVAVIPADHPLAGETSFPIEKFAGERFIMPEHGYDFDVLNILKEFHVTPDVCMSTFDSYILLEMVERGLGVSIVNSIALRGKEKEGNLKALPLSPSYSIQMGIGLLSVKAASPATMKFVEYAREIIGRRRNASLPDVPL